MMKKFSYQSSVKYLDDCLIFGIKPGLSRIEAFLKISGIIPKRFDTIHIVGTNGKTSTTIMTAEILQNHGLSCGYHISPHINEYTERLWYMGKNITKTGFAELLNEAYPFVEEVNGFDMDGPMTQFEIIAGMAFMLADREALDVMVLEAGMGGRWDATNVVDSRVVGLTGVSLEHTQVLGKTIKAIAIEKAQVIKKGALVATSTEDKTVIDVLRQQSRNTCSRLFLYGNGFHIVRKEKKHLEGWDVDISGITADYNKIFIPMLGNYQPSNLALSIAVSELYMSLSKRILHEQKIREAVGRINVSGRFQFLRKDPTVIADTSHNPEGVENFIKNLSENFPDKRKIIIFAVLKDKDYLRMLSSVITSVDILILTSSGNERSLNIDSLESEASRLINTGKNVSSRFPGEVLKIDNVLNSLNYALKISESNDIICITGSITNLEGII